MNNVVEEFSKSFSNVGPTLAKEIKHTQEGNFVQYLGERNSSSICLREVDRNEIIDIVHKFKNKTSLNWNGINVTLIKSVIIAIVAPLVHICNLTFKTSSFPNKTKIARVIPLYKAGASLYKLQTSFLTLPVLENSVKTFCCMVR